jgi:hypothetical protein
VLARDVVSAGRVRAERDGRSREAPELISHHPRAQLLLKYRPKHQLHTDCASCQAGGHDEMREMKLGFVGFGGELQTEEIGCRKRHVI